MASAVMNEADGGGVTWRYYGAKRESSAIMCLAGCLRYRPFGTRRNRFVTPSGRPVIEM